MVRTCSAYRCNSHFIKGQVSFHTFPADPVRRKLWISAVKAARKTDWNFIPGKFTWLCSKHFSDDCFYMYGLPGMTPTRVLKRDANPTIFSCPPPDIGFPKKPERRKRWITAVTEARKGKTNWNFVPGKLDFICSKHFSEDSFSTIGVFGQPKNTWLKRDAIPTIFSCLPSETIEKRSQPDEPDEVATRINPKQFKSSTNTSPQTIILPSHSEQATQNATQGNSSHIEQVHIKEEPLEADPSDYRLYQQLRDSIKTEPVNSETDSTNGDPEKHTDSISTDKEHLVNVKKEYSDSSDNEISVNHETEQIPMFESVFVKAEPFEEDDF